MRPAIIAKLDAIIAEARADASRCESADEGYGALALREVVDGLVEVRALLQPPKTAKAAIRAALAAGEVLEFDAIPARFEIEPKVAKKLLTLINREVGFRLAVSDAAGANAYLAGPGTFVRLGAVRSWEVV